MSKRLTEKERDITWRGWRKGLTHDAIATKIGKTGVCVFLHIHKFDSIEPPKRKSRPGALTLDERVAISEGLAERRSLRDIAKRLDRHPSTINREVQRNSWRRRYDAYRGEKETWKRAQRPKAGKIVCVRQSQLALGPLIMHRPRMRRCLSAIYIDKWTYAKGSL